TPPGVSLPLEPVLTVDRPMRMPLRYTCIVCCGILTRTTTGPCGESFGFHQYSPGLSGPVGLPVGVPWVWNEGLSIEYEEVSSAIVSAMVDRIFIRRLKNGNGGLKQKALGSEIGPSSYTVRWQRITFPALATGPRLWSSKSPIMQIAAAIAGQSWEREDLVLQWWGISRYRRRNVRFLL